jgi:cytochrome c553
MSRNHSSVLFAMLLALFLIGCGPDESEGLSYEEQVAQGDAVAVITPISSEVLATNVSDPGTSAPVSDVSTDSQTVASNPAPVEPVQTIAEPPKAVVEPPKAVVEPPKAVVEPPKAVVESPKAMVEPPKATPKKAVAKDVEVQRPVEARRPVEASRPVETAQPVEMAKPAEPRVNVASVSSEPVQTQKGLVGFTDDSPENIKLRSAPGDPVAGKDKSQLCQGCHGEDGRSTEGMIPHLAGQYAAYISKNLRNFQSGIRTHQIMSAMAATIDDADLADISAYFASRPKMKGRGTGAGSDVGKQIFLNGDMNRMIVSCVNCHGVNGKGKTPTNSTFPVIGGQQEGYLRGQLLSWRKGERTNSAGGIMNIIAQKLTDAEIDSLAKYISGL